jgi:hypothetical protein
MPSPRLCDTIGCRHIATWMRRTPDMIDLLLCNRCYRNLYHNHPEEAVQYFPIDASPASRSEASACESEKVSHGS